MRIVLTRVKAVRHDSLFNFVQILKSKLQVSRSKEVKIQTSISNTPCAPADSDTRGTSVVGNFF